MTPRALAARTAASLVIGGLCLWLAGRSVDPAELVSAIGHFDPFWLLPAVAVSLMIGLVRAWRWQLDTPQDLARHLVARVQPQRGIRQSLDHTLTEPSGLDEQAACDHLHRAEAGTARVGNIHIGEKRVVPNPLGRLADRQ